MRSYKWKERKICHFISALYLFKYVKSSYRIWNIRRHLLTHSLAATLLCLYSYTFHTKKKLSFLYFFLKIVYIWQWEVKENFFFEEWEIFLYFSIHSKTAMSHCVFVSTHIRYHEILSFFFSLFQSNRKCVYTFFFEKRSATNMITIETIEEKQKTWDDVWQGNFHFFYTFFSKHKRISSWL